MVLVVFDATRFGVYIMNVIRKMNKSHLSCFKGGLIHQYSALSKHLIKLLSLNS